MPIHYITHRIFNNILKSDINILAKAMRRLRDRIAPVAKRYNPYFDGLVFVSLDTSKESPIYFFREETDLDPHEIEILSCIVKRIKKYMIYNDYIVDCANNYYEASLSELERVAPNLDSGTYSLLPDITVVENPIDKTLQKNLQEYGAKLYKEIYLPMLLEHKIRSSTL
jgi:hypothetical protein